MLQTFIYLFNYSTKNVHLNKILTRAKFGERVSFLHNTEPMRKAPRDTTFGLTLYTLYVCENKIYNINILHNSILNC